MFRVASILIGYMFGCIQTAFIVGKLTRDIDIRNYGSGNLGTTNVIRVLGWKLGALTFFGDIFKAIFAVIISYVLFNNSLAGFYSGIGVIIGHNWPIFLKFRGGKGIASTIGVMLAVDYRIGIIMIVVLTIVILLTKYVSLGSIIMVSTIPILMFIFHSKNIEWIILGFILMIFALFRHRSNIERLLKGTENKLGHNKTIVSKKVN